MRTHFASRSLWVFMLVFLLLPKTGYCEETGEKINIEVLKPYKMQTFAHGDSIDFNINVTKDGEPVEGVVVKARQGLVLNDTVLLEDAGGGIYSGKGTVNKDAEGVIWISITVERDGKLYSELVLVLIEINVLSVNFNTDKVRYKVGEDIVISGSVQRDGKKMSSNLTIYLLSENPVEIPMLVTTDENGNFFYTYKIRPGEEGTWKIRIESLDENKNRGLNEKTIFVEETPDSNYFNLTFILPAQNSQFYRGDILVIKIRATRNDLPVSDADVTCSFRNKSIALNRVKEYFINEYQITEEDVIKGGVLFALYEIAQSDPVLPPVWVIHCEARREQEGHYVYGGASRSVRVARSELLVDILSPSPGEFLTNGNNVQIVVRLRYKNETAVKNAMITVKVDNDTIKLDELRQANGLYGTTRRLETEEKVWFMEVGAIDLYGNIGKASEMYWVTKTGPLSMLVNFWWLVPMMSGLFILIRYIYIEAEMPKIEKGAKEEPDGATALEKKIGELKKNKNQIEQAKSIAESKYYRREIEEMAFKKVMESYEIKLIELEVTIKDYENELGKLKK